MNQAEQFWHLFSMLLLAGAAWVSLVIVVGISHDYLKDGIEDFADLVVALIAFFVPWAFLAASVAGIVVLW